MTPATPKPAAGTPLRFLPHACGPAGIPAMRDHEVSRLTAVQLDRARRELRASLALARPDSPARIPIAAQLHTIDAEIAARTAAGPAPPGGGTVTGHDTRPLYAAIGPLHAEFPGWCFCILPCRDGPRLEGYRPAHAAGLYAVITADPAEMRRELRKPAPPREHPQAMPSAGLAAAPIRASTRDEGRSPLASPAGHGADTGHAGPDAR